jgi:hypothetical protein
VAAYLLMFVGTERDEDTRGPDEIAAAYAPVRRWWQELQDRGVGKGGRELAHSRTAMTVRRVNGRMQVTDGPFLEAKEHVGGYAVIDARDLDDAMAIARSWPPREFTIEIRPIVEHGVDDHG